MYSKVREVQRWPTPVIIKDLRAFWDLVNYYRTFVTDFAKVASASTTEQGC